MSAPVLFDRLTAYVAKVFSMASDIISIEENVICSAIKWLILNSRLPDGRFVENAPVIYIKSATVCLYVPYIFYICISVNINSRYQFFMVI